MELRNVVPWGRSFEEYRAMFALSGADLERSILGCGDGPASFNAELSSRGGRVVSADPLYRFDAASIESRIDEARRRIMPQVHANEERYVWKHIRSARALGETRMQAMRVFLEDYERGKGEGRYVDASLPRLDFPDGFFDLAVCSHYLFLYSEHIGFESHLLGMKELCRVADEVRVYPLLDLSGQLSPHLEQVETALTGLGLTVRRVPVAYEFLKGATQMLTVKWV